MGPIQYFPAEIGDSVAI